MCPGINCSYSQTIFTIKALKQNQTQRLSANLTITFIAKNALSPDIYTVHCTKPKKEHMTAPYSIATLSLFFPYNHTADNKPVLAHSTQRKTPFITVQSL